MHHPVLLSEVSCDSHFLIGQWYAYIYHQSQLTSSGNNLTNKLESKMKVLNVVANVNKSCALH